VSWTLIFLVLSIVVAVLGLWNLARGTGLFLSLVGILWLVVVLIRFYLGRLNVTIVPDLSLAGLLQYVIIPALLIFAFFARPSRR